MLVGVVLLLMVTIYGVGGIHQINGMPPRFRENGQPPKDFIVYGHKRPNNLVLPCRVTGVPTPFVTWYREGTAINQKFVKVDGTLFLRVEAYQLSSQGTNYYCTGTNNIGRDYSNPAVVRSRNVNVTIAVFNGFQAFFPKTIQIPTLLGGVVAIKCDVLPSYPEPQVEWRTDYDEVLIENLLDHTIRYLDGGRYLLLRNLTRAQRARGYYCAITNFADSPQRSPITYTLGEDIPPLEFVEYLELGTKAAKVGEEIELVYAAAEADANGQNVLLAYLCQSEFVSLRREGGIILFLTLKENARSATEVTFTCTLSPSERNVTGTIQVLRDLGENDGTGPVIVDPAPINSYQLDRERRMGFSPSVLFNCVVSANQPSTTITWYHNGLIINSGFDGKVLHENGSLTIQHPTVSHFGIYQCHAVNDLNDANRVWFLEVRIEEQIRPVNYSYVYFSVPSGRRERDFRRCTLERRVFDCNDPTATILFDDLRPNAVRVYGKNRAVDSLVTLRATEANMTIKFNPSVDFTGIKRIEIELLDCETAGISMETITFSAGEMKPIVTHPSPSCSKLVKVCLPIIPPIHPNEINIKFNSRKPSDWMAISDINFYTEVDSCETPVTDVVLEIIGDNVLHTFTPPRVIYRNIFDCTIATIASAIATTLWNGPVTTRDAGSKNESSFDPMRSDLVNSTLNDSNLIASAAIFAFIGGSIFVLLVQFIIWKVLKIQRAREMSELSTYGALQNDWMNGKAHGVKKDVGDNSVISQLAHSFILSMIL